MQKLSKQDIAILWNKMLQNQATADELKALLDFIETSGAEEVLAEFSSDIGREIPGAIGFTAMDEEQKNLLVEKVFGVKHDSLPELPPVRRINFLQKWKWAAAAVLLIVAMGALYLLNKPGPVSQEPVADKQQLDIRPGKQGAVLVLADGSELVLDSLGNGVVANQNGSEAIIRNGELVYNVKKDAAREITYNTMRTPKGRQFTLLLPDGTRVWLNAASSIHYPTAFTGKSREVQVTGEVYFEVAKNREQPFRVNAENIEVEVLGTSFNVNAYENENGAATTLLDGRVKVSTGNNSQLLRPGQQAKYRNGASVELIDGTDLDKVMAWKNGRFNFNGASLEEVMRQLERWYDIEVVYPGKIPQRQFWGEMGMDLQLNDILLFLEKSNIKFKREGRQIIVIP